MYKVVHITLHALFLKPYGNFVFAYFLSLYLFSYCSTVNLAPFSIRFHYMLRDIYKKKFSFVLYSIKKVIRVFETTSR